MICECLKINIQRHQGLESIMLSVDQILEILENNNFPASPPCVSTKFMSLFSPSPRSSDHTALLLAGPDCQTGEL